MKQEDVLSHYGILGMQWGKRKGQVNKSSTQPPKVKDEEFQNSRKLKRKSVSQLSNAQLQDYVTRMNLEKQYKKLKKDDISEGQKMVQDMLKDIGKELVKDALKTSIKGAAKLAKKG